MMTHNLWKCPLTVKLVHGRSTVHHRHLAVSTKGARTGKNPKVALTIDTNTFPPHLLLVRGIAKVEVKDGVAPEFLAAARRYLGEEQGAAFEAEARAIYKQMARIEIEPHWVKLLDFQTRLPSAFEAGG